MQLLLTPGSIPGCRPYSEFSSLFSCVLISDTGLAVLGEGSIDTNEDHLDMRYCLQVYQKNTSFEIAPLDLLADIFLLGLIRPFW